MKISLLAKASGLNYSLESGLSDGQKNFDHHGQFAGQSAPCADNRIPILSANDVVEISHIDADSFVGLLRMAGRELPQVDFDLMEKIDLSGTSVCPDKFDSTVLYMVGVNQLARDLKFPRVMETSTDVSSVVEAMMAKTAEEIIAIGREATVTSETAYVNCRKAVDGKVGYWRVGATDAFDPSRPYEDGVEVVVVQRVHYATISIYCSPKSVHAFGGQEIAGIPFAGHPKAAGSPRGAEMTDEMATSVFDALAKKISGN